MLDDEEVAVIGNGSMGIALAHAVATAGHRTVVRCPDAMTADVVGDAALVIVAVPSTQFRETARGLGALGVFGKALLSSTKGFEPDTYLRMSEILAQETGAAAVGAIAGANITPEIVAGELTAIVVASHDSEVRALAKRCLESRQLRVGLDEDLLSIELTAALKNVVAVGVGIAAGLGLGFNARSIVFACGLREITILGAALGAEPGIFAGSAGAGDLFLTASSPDSLNRRLGVELGRGARLADIVGELPEVPEGIGSIRACRALARSHDFYLPIAEAVAAILEGERDATALEAACRETPFA